jgi:hypothetical protein
LHARKGNSHAQRVVNQVLRRKRTNGEFRFSAQIGEYDVDNVILDLGSDVNVFPQHARLKSTCKEANKPNHIRVRVFEKYCNGYKPIK